MYRQGLGDCFLITFNPDGNEAHMLIDCGSLGVSADENDKKLTLAQVVASIRETTKGHINLLVGTHEHKDHLVGFLNNKDVFKGMTVDHVWLAWTENPGDTDAQVRKKYAKDLGASLAVAAKALASGAPANSQSAKLGSAVHDLLEFGGDPDALGAFSESINDAMNFLRTGFGFEARYLSPGMLIEEPWLPGFRFYVLGPPRSKEALSDTGDHQSPELYHVAAGLRVGAAMKLDESAVSSEECEHEMPFDARFRLKADHPQIAKFLQGNASENYGYLLPDQAWRKIDDDWLHAAADLALQLDDLTNNTSLALAIERISDGTVLLFPADAQQGNWLSWHNPEMRWTVPTANSTPRQTTAAQLLNNAVFYKAGHHASHNGTAKNKGLELMEKADELVAFIPVDRAIALGRNPPGSWNMPAAPLYKALLDKCQGRVVRSDLGWADDAKNAKNKTVEKELLNLVDAKTWAKYKASQSKAEKQGVVSVTPQFIDFSLL